jgi:hypothetical protein
VKSLLVAGVIAAVLAVPAAAQAPTTLTLQREVAALQKQNRILSNQLVQLRTEVAAMQTQMTNGLTTDANWATCYYASSMDETDNVWHVLNTLAAALGYQAQPDLPRFDDKGACAAIGVTRSGG